MAKGKMSDEVKRKVGQSVFGKAGPGMIPALNLGREALYEGLLEALLRQVIERMNVLVSQNNTVGRMYVETIREEMEKLRAEVKATRAKLRRKL